MKRREYEIDIVFNGIGIKKVIIDPHFELKHAASINDQIILALVQKLDGLSIPPEEEKPPYSYFVEDLSLNNKIYRLVWLVEDDQIYIGVINTFRR